MLYRALAGTLPWRATAPVEMLRAHQYAEPAALPSVPELPRSVASLCHACLEKDPAMRPSAVDVAQSLAAAAEIKVPPLPVTARVAAPSLLRRWWRPAQRLREVTVAREFVALRTDPLPAVEVGFAA